MPRTLTADACLLLFLLLTGATSVTAPAPAATSAKLSRDEELLPHGGPLRRLSLFGGLGFADIHGRSSMPEANARLAFDIGGLYDLRSPLRLGLSFNHLSFRQLIPDPEGEAPPLDAPFEVSDISTFVRLDARRRHAVPYALAGGGIYLAENGARGDLVRMAGGVEVPVAWGLGAVEFRLSSYANGAFLDDDPNGRQWSVEMLFGFRIPLRHQTSATGIEELGRKDRARVIVRYIATPEELAELDSLTSDEPVDAFMEAFWDRRDPYPDAPGNPFRDEHLARMAAAASRYREAGRPGWSTERGRILILYGEPDEVVREQQRLPRSGADDPHVVGDRGTPAAYELWIHYRRLPHSDGQQSLFLFAEDLLSRHQIIWCNVSGEPGYSRPLPPLPASLRGPVDAAQ